MLPHIHFCSPKNLPDPTTLPGRVVVLDVAFSARGLKPSYEEMTGPFIDHLGARLAAWVDHHDHEFHRHYENDHRFLLSTKAEHPACPEMITPKVVRDTGPIDTIVCHLDLDGLYSAAKWLTKGYEPYEGADQDAVCVDSRQGTPSPIARTIDYALRARFRDEQLKFAIINHLLALHEGRPSPWWEHIEALGRQFEPLAKNARELALSFDLQGEIAYISVDQETAFDKTELLLEGQKRATVAAIEHSGNVTFAAPFDSGVDFVALFDLGGGMPTRVTVASNRADDFLQRLRAHFAHDTSTQSPPFGSSEAP